MHKSVAESAMLFKSHAVCDTARNAWNIAFSMLQTFVILYRDVDGGGAWSPNRGVNGFFLRKTGFVGT